MTDWYLPTSEADGSSDDAPSKNVFNVGMDQYKFWRYDRDVNIKLLRTYGLNGCTGILIVGGQGALLAHLSPIEAGWSNGHFMHQLKIMVKKPYLRYKSLMENPTMYVVYSNSDHGELELVRQLATRLEIPLIEYEYPILDDHDCSDAEEENQDVTTMHVNFSNVNNLRVVIFGDVQP